MSGHAFRIDNATKNAEKAEKLRLLLDNPISGVSDYVVQVGKLDAHILHGTSLSNKTYFGAREWYNEAARDHSPVYGIAISICHLFDFDPLDFYKTENGRYYYGSIVSEQSFKMTNEMINLGINAFHVRHEPQGRLSEKFNQWIIFIPHTKVKELDPESGITYEEGDTRSIQMALEYLLKKGVLDINDPRHNDLITKTFSAHTRHSVLVDKQDLCGNVTPLLKESDLLTYSPDLTKQEIRAFRESIQAKELSLKPV